jgi:hypothetical protein
MHVVIGHPRRFGLGGFVPNHGVHVVIGHPRRFGLGGFVSNHNDSEQNSTIVSWPSEEKSQSKKEQFQNFSVTQF